MTAKETAKLLVLPEGCKILATHEDGEVSKSLVPYTYSPTIEVEAQKYSSAKTIERRLRKIDPRWYHANTGTSFSGTRLFDFFRAEF